MSATEPTLLTLQEAADIVGCHYQTLYRRVRKGEVPALVAGGSYRISYTQNRNQASIFN
jgi:excisionase family DNA binding protein